MTVRAYHLALRNFVQDALPIPITQVLADREALGPDMVKLEHNRVPLAAIGAWMHHEVFDEVRSALGCHGSFATEGTCDVPMTVCGVTLLLVIGTAGAAVVIALRPRLPPPGKLL